MATKTVGRAAGHSLSGSPQVPSTAPQRPPSLVELFHPLIAREIAAIGAIDSAIAHESHPSYVVLLHATKLNKQANVEQMATVIRMTGGDPPEQAVLRKLMMKAQTVLTWRLGGTTATLSAMRFAELDLLRRYTSALDHADGLARHAVRKALTRTIVQWHILTAHLARQTGRGASMLPRPLREYFAGQTPKACMRCHLDRPGSHPPLERVDPHPYTYICAGCHDDVRAEFPPDLASQMDGWPPRVQDARVLQHAIGRPSTLHAFHAVLQPLSGLPVEVPVPAVAKAIIVPAIEPPPQPAAHESATTQVDPMSEGEREYVATLFDYRSVRRFW